MGMLSLEILCKNAPILQEKFKKDQAFWLIYYSDLLV